MVAVYFVSCRAVISHDSQRACVRHTLRVNVGVTHLLRIIVVTYSRIIHVHVLFRIVIGVWIRLRFH